MCIRDRLATLDPPGLPRAEASRYQGAMDRLSADAFAAYRALVYGEPGFRAFFRAMTPISEIATLKIGSRPPSRTASDAIEDLRAIPWAVSYTHLDVYKRQALQTPCRCWKGRAFRVKRSWPPWPGRA